MGRSMPPATDVLSTLRAFRAAQEQRVRAYRRLDEASHPTSSQSRRRRTGDQQHPIAPVSPLLGNMGCAENAELCLESCMVSRHPSGQ